MTIPALVSSYQKLVLKAQFRKAYSSLNQAYKAVESNVGYNMKCFYWETNPYGGNKCAEHDEAGEFTKWVLSDGSDLSAEYNGVFSECGALKKQMEKVLKVTKKCTSNAYAQGCIPDYEGNDTIWESKNGGNKTDYEKIYATTGCGGWRKNAIKTKREAWVLDDGTIILFFLHHFVFLL